MEEINALLEKYDSFKYEQLRSIQQLEDSSKILTIAVMDDDGEDTNLITITFTDINASKILVDSVLSYMDMGRGITLIRENGLYGFAVDYGTSMLHVRSAPLYIISSEIKIEDKEV